MASQAAEAERLRLYTYATAQEASSYVAIMRLFVGALLAERSAHDLVERGIDLPVAAIDQRLRYLEQNGNLLASPTRGAGHVDRRIPAPARPLHGHQPRCAGAPPGRGGPGRHRRRPGGAP